MSPPSTNSPSPSSDQAPTKVKGKAQRLFGDTLTKNLTPNRAPAQQPFTPTHPIKSKEPVIKSAVSKIVPPPAANAAVNNPPAVRPSRINPISYLRRERTFDMTLTQTQNAEKFQPRFSPQFQRKTAAMMNLPRMEVVQTTKTSEIRQMTTQERYRANLANRNNAFQSELSSATKQRTTITSAKTKPTESIEKMKTIDKKLAKKKQAVPPPLNADKTIEKSCVEAKKSSDNSAISNPTMSTSSSFRYSKAKQQSSMPYEMTATPTSKESPEIVGYTQHPSSHHPQPADEEDLATSRESIIKENTTHAQQFNNSGNNNNFYYGMQEASVDTDDEIENEPNHAQMDAVNKFAEDIFKMSGSGSKNQGEEILKIILTRFCEFEFELFVL